MVIGIRMRKDSWMFGSEYPLSNQRKSQTASKEAKDITSQILEDQDKEKRKERNNLLHTYFRDRVLSQRREIMRVFEKNEIIHSTGLICLIYGDPGIGKTTLAFTAPNPILLDFDRGAHRASLGKKTVQFDSWADLQANENDLQALFEAHESIIIDTAGTLLESMTNFIVESQPGLAKNGIKLWGELKKMFNEFFQPLKKLNKNIIFIAHAKEKEEGDFRIKRPLIPGSSYDLIMQSADLVGYYTANGSKRVLTFDLSETVTAKNCADIKPVYISDIPTMHSQLGEIITHTKKALLQRIEEHDHSIEIVKEWEKIAEDADPDTLFNLVSGAKIKKNEKSAVWAKVTQIMRLRGFTFDKTDNTFKPIGDES
jgi:DNA replication protein DnaC